MSRAYIAKYPDADHEVILASDTYWSPHLSALFDQLVRDTDDNLQGWYSNAHQVDCMAMRWNRVQS